MSNKDKTIRIPMKGEVYEHYKGNLYIVVGHAHDTETGNIVVLYKHFNQKSNKHAFLWSRPIDIWAKPVKIGNNEIARFVIRRDLMEERKNK